ncbi:hypothetical protein [Pedobacter sp.]
MKKLLLTLCIAFSAVVFANAQDAPKKPTSFGWNKAQLTEIGCDADQIKKIAAIKKEATAKRTTIEADAALDEKAKKTAIKAAVKERNEAMNAVLTDEQRKKVEEINAKLKEEAKAGSN